MARVGATATRLHDAGVRRGDRVGVRVVSGSKELYLSILGVLAAGAAYVPVDADDPDERARLVFGEAKVRGVISGDGEYVPRDETESDAASAPLFDGAAPHPSTHAIVVVPPPTVDDDAWIIFTSGSTGVPKGVAVSHRSAAAFVDAEARIFLQDAPLGPGDRVLAGLSVAFDASCEEMWLAWGHGACLVPAPRSLVRSGEDLAPWLIRQSITVVSTVPTLAAMWPIAALENVRLLIFGGEACPPELAARLAADGREVWNTYGPTEATVVACAAPLDGSVPVRIGLPLDGWALAVVDAEGEQVAEGQTGRAHHRRRRPRPLPRSRERPREVRAHADARLGPRVPVGRPRALRRRGSRLPGPRRRPGEGRRTPHRTRRGGVCAAGPAGCDGRGRRRAHDRCRACPCSSATWWWRASSTDPARASPSPRRCRPPSCRSSPSSTSSRCARPARSTAPRSRGRSPASRRRSPGSAPPKRGWPSSGRRCSGSPSPTARPTSSTWAADPSPRRSWSRASACACPNTRSPTSTTCRASVRWPRRSVRS